jgi:hypothetical protein
MLQLRWKMTPTILKTIEGLFVRVSLVPPGQLTIGHREDRERDKWCDTGPAPPGLAGLVASPNCYPPRLPVFRVSNRQPGQEAQTEWWGNVQ